MLTNGILEGFVWLWFFVVLSLYRQQLFMGILPQKRVASGTILISLGLDLDT